MHGLRAQDGRRAIDWGRTSSDYALHRPGYPDSFYARLVALGVGLPGQRVLDLGTGTGTLARALARRGCHVTGVDVSKEQIEAARELASSQALSARFEVRPAEETGEPEGAFDVVTAAQCWLYFDRDRAIREVKRVLAASGVLVTCHMCWLPRLDEVARASEALVRKHNPDWSAADWSGHVPPVPSWIGEDFVVQAMFFYDEPVSFTRESWRGRIRACRGVGATLAADESAAFDREHDELLHEICDEPFSVLHRFDAHVLLPRR